MLSFGWPHFFYRTIVFFIFNLLVLLFDSIFFHLYHIKFKLIQVKRLNLIPNINTSWGVINLHHTNIVGIISYSVINNFEEKIIYVFVWLLKGWFPTLKLTRLVWLYFPRSILMVLNFSYLLIMHAERSMSHIGFYNSISWFECNHQSFRKQWHYLFRLDPWAVFENRKFA